MTCSIDDCDRPARSQAKCSMHYQRINRGYAHRNDPRSMTDRTRARIEDLEFLVDGGVVVAEAVERCGWTLDGAARALYRHDHPMASRVERARRAA